MGIVTLPTVQDKERQSAIIILEDCLREVKEGRIRSVAIAIIEKNNCMNATWSEGDLSSMLGAISLLNYRMLKASEEN